MLGCAVLVFNVVGYLGGFLLVDFNIRYTRNQNDAIHQYKRQSDHPARFQDDLLTSPIMYAAPVLSVGQTTTTSTGSSPWVVRRTTPGPSAAAARYSKRTPLSKSVVQHSDPCVYSSGRSTDDGRWYNFSVSSYTFYAYSAFLDDRKSLLSEPVIRIIGLGSKPEDDSDEKNLRLFCLLHYDEPDRIVHVPMIQSADKIGYGWVLNNEWVREYVFTCPLFESKVPRALAVVGHSGDIVASCMPVERPLQPERKEDFGVCVQVAFDNINTYRLTEWLELQWILGVRHVGIYSLSLDRETVDALQPYVKEGYVDLRKTDYIEHGPQQYLLQGSPVINDCIYRNMHRFHYILVIDFDEVIVPKGHTSLRELVDFLQQNYSTMASPPVNYIFYNNYFFLDHSPDTSESPYLTMLRYRKRSPVSPFGYSVKSIIDSRACLAMHNHYCFTVTKGYTDRGFPQVVDYSIAVNQHYKKCHLNQTECHDLMSKAVQDDTILRYAKQLKTRVADRILSIKGHNI